MLNSSQVLLWLYINILKIHKNILNSFMIEYISKTPSCIYCLFFKKIETVLKIIIPCNFPNITTAIIFFEDTNLAIAVFPARQIPEVQFLTL